MLLARVWCCAPCLQALRVLLQQRVSAVAVLAGTGPSPNMRLVGNLSASDLRHLRKGGFGGLALTVKAFLASKPLAPDQVCICVEHSPRMIASCRLTFCHTAYTQVEQQYQAVSCDERGGWMSKGPSFHSRACAFVPAAAAAGHPRVSPSQQHQ